ncbi:MAG TPA: translin family protein [Candidatus Thermoplasmatota archaeon]|nr:translin family protein [Candidatus Thermoplasmatota archaeon]
MPSGSLANLSAIADDLIRDLDAKDAARERAIALSRETVRLSGAAIRAVQRGEDADAALAEALASGRRLADAVEGHMELAAAGFTENAQQEVAEAAMVVAIAKDRPLPRPRDLPVTPQAYVLGLGDVVGELRRLALADVVAADEKRAARHLAMMEEVLDTLLRFDYPGALVEVRRKQDVARSLVERTRGEVAVALVSARLEQRLRSV